MSAEQSSPAHKRLRRAPTREQLPPLVERGALSIFDEAVTFLRIQPGLLLGLAAAVLLPLRMIGLAVPGSPLRDARPDEILDIFVGNLDTPGAVFALLVTIMLDSLALFTVASIYGELTAAWYSGEVKSSSQLLLSSIRRSPVLLLAWALLHFIEAAFAVVSLGIGAFLIGGFLIVTAPVIGAESAGPIEALRRSGSLAGSKLVHVLAVFALTGGGALVMRLMLEAAPSLIGLELLGLPLWLISGVADTIASVLVTAFVAATSTVLYLDLRVRREGIDLTLAMGNAFATKDRV